MPRPKLLSNCLIAALLACVAGCGLYGRPTIADSPPKSFPSLPELWLANKYMQADAKGVISDLPQPGPGELQKNVASRYTIRPADGLTLEPIMRWRPVKLSGERIVTLDGSIDLGKYGRLFVAGQTLERIEVDVAAAVEAVELRPVRIKVRLSKPAGAVFYVVGEVNAPGAYPLTGHETVRDAIAAAKGLTAHASPCRMLLTRTRPAQGGETEIPICYRQIMQSGDASANVQLMPGDSISVPPLSIVEEVLPLYRNGCLHCRGAEPSRPEPAASDPATSAPVDALPEPALAPGTQPGAG